jgi:NAD(P)-dependent dehydrogenase (short-subunit alcohol dehydrogenase family)
MVDPIPDLGRSYFTQDNFLETTMDKPICLVTGANRGIGKEVALGLAKQGAHIVMVCRNAEHGAAAQQDIQQQTNNTQVDLLLADLASQDSVRGLAATVQSRYARLHVLINNAGLALTVRTVSLDGIEMTLAVNHLAGFLLTNLLLDLIKRSAPARIINVASVVHQWGTLHFDNLQFEHGYDIDKAYYQSKLANVLFTYELHRRLGKAGVTVNSFDPRMTATDFAKDRKGFAGFMAKVWKPFMNSSRTSGANIVHLATSPAFAGVSGQYVVSRKAIRSSSASYDESTARRLWDVSAALVKLA